MDSEKVPIQVYPVAGPGRTNARRADAFITRFGVEYKVHSPALVNGQLGNFLIANLTPEEAIVTLPAEIVLPGVGSVDVPRHAHCRIRAAVWRWRQAFLFVVMRVDGDLVTAQGEIRPRDHHRSACELDEEPRFGIVRWRA